MPIIITALAACSRTAGFASAIPARKGWSPSLSRAFFPCGPIFISARTAASRLLDGFSVEVSPNPAEVGSLSAAIRVGIGSSSWASSCIARSIAFCNRSGRELFRAAASWATVGPSGSATVSTGFVVVPSGLTGFLPQPDSTATAVMPVQRNRHFMI